MSSRLSSERIKAEAKALGFFACGIAKVEAVSPDCADKFRHWLDTGGHAGMDYMARNVDKRLDPCLLIPGVKSIVCVALNYAPAERMPDGELQFAATSLNTAPSATPPLCLNAIGRHKPDLAGSGATTS